jgi:hypothetical protein
MRWLMIIMLGLLPILSYGQLFEHSNSFFYASSDVDAVNVVDLGDGINGYNGTYNVGYRNHKVNMELSYETFPNLEFWAIGAGGSIVLNHESRLNFLLGLEASLIWRGVEGKERGRDPSAAINIQVEYHLNRWFIYIKDENRYRGDLKAMYGKNAKPYVNSVFVGVGIKLFKKRI